MGHFSLSQRRWFLRISLAVLVVVVLGAAYFRRWAGERQAFIARTNVFGFANVASQYPRTPAPWYLRPFGADGYASIAILMPNENPALLRYAESLFPEAYISHVPPQGEGRDNFDAVLKGYTAQDNPPVD